MEKHRVRKWVIRGVCGVVFAWVVFAVLYSRWITQNLDLVPDPPTAVSEKQVDENRRPGTEAQPLVDMNSATITPVENGAKETAETVADDEEQVVPHSHPHPHPHPETAQAIPEGFAHVDALVVKEGYSDYNRYRYSDPERAYQRLTETFQYIFGEVREVETLVDFVRQANRGPLTIDELMDLNHVYMKLFSALSPADVEFYRETNRNLQKLKSDALDHGMRPDEMLIEYTFDFDDSDRR